MTLELSSEPGTTVYLPAEAGDKIHCVIHADNNIRIRGEYRIGCMANWRDFRKEFLKGQLLAGT